MSIGLAQAAAILGPASLAAWTWLLLLRGGFWRIDRRPPPPPPPEWPDVAAVIPARNEAPHIGCSIASLLAQEYPGRLSIAIVDDQSEDGTADEARRAGGESVRVVQAGPRPPGWTGKVWAMRQGIASLPADGARYVLLADADIRHGPAAVRELVSRAEAGPCDLASFMVRLECRSLPERLLIPAFVFFFRLLYPFAWVNDPRSPAAGAAGGTLLVRRDALARIGGMEALRAAVIDDCTLAGLVKRSGGRLWLGLADSSRSLRGYGTCGEVLAMVARTAYTQLGCSPLRLAACLAGLGFVFLAPPALALLGGGVARWTGAAAWMLMSALYAPMVRFYGLPWAWAPLLPLTATLYLGATAASAWHHHRGRGGWWKGRPQAAPGGSPSSRARARNP